jgi:hypothetical protein
MKEMFSAKTIAALFAAATVTGTMLASFDQATTRVPTQWPISIEGVAQSVQQAA